MRYALLSMLALFASKPHASLEAKEALWDELGRVEWGRSLERALTASRSTRRPVFLLFQEVPGCKTCSDYGRQVLSQPLLVEAIESLFVPVLVYNNREGADQSLLKRFDEPAWNNPVVRYLSADGKDVLPRRARVWSLGATAERMVAVLRAVKRPIPAYLELLAAEGRPLETATLGTHCFWDGEALLGSAAGVVRTEVGWVGFVEVVSVEFDARQLPFPALLRQAKALGAAQGVFAHNERQRKQAAKVGGLEIAQLPEAPRSAKAGDRKFALSRSPLRHLPLTPAQAAKVNGALRLGKNVDQWLSPRQLVVAQAIRQRLVSEPGALEAWTPPATLAALAEYQNRLRLHLGLEDAVERVESKKRAFPKLR